MKRLVVLMLVLLLGVCLTAVVGCGGQTGEAKAQMKKADDAYTTVDRKLTKVKEKATPVLTALMGGKIDNLANATQVMQEVGAIFETSIDELDGAKKEYEKILDLEGVEPYAEYAKAMMKTIDIQKDAVNEGKALFAKMAPAVATGDMTRVTEAVKGASADIAKVMKLEQDTTNALREAQKIKVEKNLEK